MKVERSAIAEVLLLEPKVFSDARGFFLESYNKRAFRQATGLEVEFVQDNHSRSSKNVLRGLHYQLRQPQGTADDGPGAGGPHREGALDQTRVQPRVVQPLARDGARDCGE